MKPGGFDTRFGVEMSATRTRRTADLPPVSQTRGQRLRDRRLANGLSVNQLHKASSVSREAIVKAEDGEASDLTYSRLETWFDNFEDETSGPVQTPAVAPDADPHVVTFRLSGNFGVDVVVSGPVENIDELRETVERLMRGMGEK